MVPSDLHARDLVESQEVIDAGTLIRDVVSWYQRQNEIDFAAITHEGSVVGMIGRDQLNARLAGKYGYSVMADKAVSRVMITNPLMVDGANDIQKLTRLLLESNRPRQEFYYDIIVYENGSFLGLASVKRLITGQMQRIFEQMGSMQKHADVLAQKNRELLAAAMRSDQSHTEFEQFMESSSIPILVLDDNGNFARANPRYFRLTGLLPSAIREGTPGDLLVKGGIVPIKHRAAGARFDSTDKNRTHQIILLGAQGAEIGVEVSIDQNTGRGHWLISIIRLGGGEEKQLQQFITDKLRGRGGLAGEFAANMIDREADVETLMRKLDSVFDVAEKIEQASVRSGTGSDLTGTLSTFGPVDLMQLLVHGQKTGALSIQSEAHGNATVYFQTGQFAHAECLSFADTPAMSGKDALRRVLKFQTGNFNFRYDEASPEQTIRGDPMTLLVTICAENDEEELMGARQV